MLPADVPEEIFRELAVRTPVNHREITFLAPGDLTEHERRIVPEAWLRALQRSGRDGLRLMIDYWDSVLPRPLPGITARFRDAGADLILGRQLGLPVLIYVLDGQFGHRRHCTWVGSLPRSYSAIPQRFQRLPESFLSFHTHLHDGFDTTLSGGVLPFEYMDLVGEYYEPDQPFEMYPSAEWDDAERLAAPTEQADWNQVVLVATNGGSGRLCAILDAEPNAIDGWYWFEGSMSPEADAWKTLDRWLTRGATDWCS